MSFRTTFGWNHDFPRLVRQLGFKFIADKPKVIIDWNLIGCVNIDDIIANSEVTTIEKHINDVIYYSMQSEEIRILDPKFVKLFRLAQLTIEYLLFCLHYLDKGLIQLQNNFIFLEKKNEELYEELAKKDKVLQKYKKKMDSMQGVSNYCQDDMTGSDVFECNECNKKFVNESFLKSHQLRRQHSNPVPSTNELSSQEQKLSSSNVYNEKYKEETDKLFAEIKQLKERLNDTEQILKVEIDKNSNEKLEKVVKSNENLSATTRINNNNYEKQYSEISIQVNSIDIINKAQNNSIQCDLIGENHAKLNKSVDSIRVELKRWREEEASQILKYLENIKEKFYFDLEKLRETQMQISRPSSGNDIALQAQRARLEALEQNLERKLDSNVERLKYELAAQENKWREKLTQLEIKSELITELTKKVTVPIPIYQQPKILSVQHNSPIIISHNHVDGNLNGENIKKIQHHSKKIVQVSETQNKKHKQKTAINESPSSLSSEDTYSSETSSTTKNKNKRTTQNESEYNQTELVKHKKNVQFKKSSKPVTKTIFTKKKSLLNEKVVLPEDGGEKYDDIAENKQGDVVVLKQSQSTLGKRSLTSLKDAVLNDPQFLSEFRKTMLDVLHASLKELGVDPEWTTLPQQTLETHFKTLQHSQKFIAKQYPSYYDIRNEILLQIDGIVAEQLAKKLSTSPEIMRPPTTRGYPPFKLPLKKNCPKPSIKFANSPKKIRSDPSHIKHQDVSPIITGHSSPDRNIKPNFEGKLSFSQYAEKDALKRPLDEKFKRDDQSRAESLVAEVESTSNVLTTMRKMKDKVLSAFRAPSHTDQKENNNKNVRPWGQRGRRSQTGETNITEGIYKLRTVDQKNTLSSPKGKIISINPLQDEYNIDKDKSPIKKDITINSSTSPLKAPSPTQKNDFKSDQIHSLFIKSPDTSPNRSSSKNERQYDPFIVKHSNIPKPITTTASPKGEISPQKTSETPQNVVSMYGDNDSSNSTDKSFQLIKNVISPPKEVIAVQPVSENVSTETPNRNQDILYNTNDPERKNIAKKRVLFNLKLNRALSGVKTESKRQETNLSSLSTTVNIKSPPVKDVKEPIVAEQSHPLKQSTLNLIIDQDDTTSISSSVFDGSVKNSEDNNKPNVKVTFKDVKISPQSDDLVLSDFDFSSDK